MAAKLSKVPVLALASATVLLGLARPAHAAIQWKGYEWQVTNGGMAGVADGAAANVTIDAEGFLHLRVVKTGNTWTASELFTTQNLGFGTYQWHIEGPVDTFDKQIVLGLFPYGPADGIGGDGTNEIDIEWARWGYADGTNIGFTNYPNSGSTVGSKAFKVSLGGGTSSTARFIWTSQYIDSSVLKGHQALNSNEGLLAGWKYAPSNPTTNIPQRAMPLGINLWCFDAPPSDGKNVEVVLRDFKFVKEGDPLPSEDGNGGTGAGGSAGTSSGGSAGTTSGGSSQGGTAGESAAGTTSGGTNNGGSANGGSSSGGSGSPTAGGTNSGGSASAAGSGGSSTSAGGATTSGGTSPSGGAAGSTGGDSTDDGGCSCHVAGQRGRSAGVGVLAVLGLGLAWRKRRRAA
jgi:MYXO-CTERM domain-containing protein